MADDLVMLDSAAHYITLACKQIWRRSHDVNKLRSMSTNMADDLIILYSMAPAIILNER